MKRSRYLSRVTLVLVVVSVSLVAPFLQGLSRTCRGGDPDDGCSQQPRCSPCQG